MRTAILTLLLLPSVGAAIESAHYSIRTEAEWQTQLDHVDTYIGQYGEMLRFSRAFTLLPPTLDHGVEAIRLYNSELRRLNQPIPRPADFTPGNFYKLDLAEILVIPQSSGYRDLDALREDKIAYLKSQKAVFTVDGALARYQYQWPTKTFWVYVKSPSEMTQLYTAKDGLVYIATLGRDIREEHGAADDQFLKRRRMRQLAQSIGAYFLHLDAIEEGRLKDRSINFNWRVYWSFPYIAAFGLLCLVLPRGKSFFRPIAYGTLSACVLGILLTTFGFIFARQVLRWEAQDRFTSVWVWDAFLVPIPMISILLSRSVAPVRRWAALGLCLATTVILATFNRRIVHGVALGNSMIEDFGMCMHLMGLLQGFCAGLLIDFP